jgi:hypothetical protein
MTAFICSISFALSSLPAETRVCSANQGHRDREDCGDDGRHDEGRPVFQLDEHLSGLQEDVDKMGHEWTP